MRSEARGIFEGRIKDLISTSAYSVKTSDFLTPSEQAEAFSIARTEGADGRCFFWGGLPEAERRFAVFLPEWLTPDAGICGGAFDPEREDALREIISSGADGGEISGHAVPVLIEGSAYSELSHRDYLGSVLSLGIERDSIGDIDLITPSSAYVFALEGASRLLIREMSSVGREKVTASPAVLPEGFRAAKEYEPVSGTVMSLRLDGVVRVLCSVSREDAATLVSSGDVSVNYVVVTKPDSSLEPGDVISVRGYGKFIFDGDRGVNRRGRLRIDARKFI